MNDSKDSPANQTEAVVTGHVKRMTAVGLIIDLGYGREGLVREREISWDAEERQSWRRRFKMSQQVRAVVLKQDAGHRQELSLRLVQRDPWQTVCERYPIGKIVDGVVNSTTHYGVFVELEPGVNGLAHVSRFPDWEKREPGDIFWPGDRLRVRVRSIDSGLRRIGLGLGDICVERWQRIESGGTPPTNSLAESVGAGKNDSALENLFPHLALPLTDIAPDWLHPRLGFTIAQMAANLRTDGKTETQPL